MCCQFVNKPMNAHEERWKQKQPSGHSSTVVCSNNHEDSLSKPKPMWLSFFLNSDLKNAIISFQLVCPSDLCDHVINWGSAAAVGVSNSCAVHAIFMILLILLKWYQFLHILPGECKLWARLYNSLLLHKVWKRSTSACFEWSVAFSSFLPVLVVVNNAVNVEQLFCSQDFKKCAKNGLLVSPHWIFLLSLSLSLSDIRSGPMWRNSQAWRWQSEREWKTPDHLQGKPSFGVYTRCFTHVSSYLESSLNTTHWL